MIRVYTISKGKIDQHKNPPLEDVLNFTNIIWMDLLRYFFNLNSVVELITIGLFKSGPLILLLVFLWRHYSELFASYETASWQIE